MNRQEDSWPPLLGGPTGTGGGCRRGARRAQRQAPADLRPGPLNHENAVAVPGFHRAGPPLRRRHVHERSADRRLRGRRSAGPVAGLLVHRPQCARRAGRQGRPVRVRVRHARRQELLRHRTRVGDGRQGPLHQGAEGHRDRAQPGRPEIKAADKGYPAPPSNGSWQTDLRSTVPLGIDGPQWVLEYWSDTRRVPVRPHRGHRL